jgi:hypothetical protein
VDISKIKPICTKAMEFLYSKSSLELKQWFWNLDIDAKAAVEKNVSGGSGNSRCHTDFTFKAFDTLDKMNLDTTEAFGENLMGRQA